MAPEIPSDLIVFPLLYVSSSLSVIGAANILSVYFAHRSEQSFTFKLIVYLTFFNFWGSVAWFLNYPDPIPSVCLAGAVLSNFFFVGVFVSIFCLAFNHYHIMKRGEELAHRLEKYYLFLMLAIPSICILFPLVFGMYTPEREGEEIGCWYSDEYFWGKILFFDGFIFVSWIYIAVLLVFAKRQVNTMKAFAQLSPGFMENAVGQSRMVRAILFTFVVCWVWSVILSIIMAISTHTSAPFPTTAVYYTRIFFAIFCPLQGFLNWIVLLVVSKKFRFEWKSVMRSLICLPPLPREEEALIVGSERHDSFAALYQAFEDEKIPPPSKPQSFFSPLRKGPGIAITPSPPSSPEGLSARNRLDDSTYD